VALPKDHEIENLAKAAWRDLPEHYKRALLRRAKSDLWWEEATHKLQRHQSVFVIVVGALGLVGMFREYVSEIAQWVANMTKGQD